MSEPAAVEKAIEVVHSKEAAFHRHYGSRGGQQQALLELGDAKKALLSTITAVITPLQEENERLREALKKIKDCSHAGGDQMSTALISIHDITVAALSPIKATGSDKT